MAAVPIVVGVTGHRDIPSEDIPKLRSIIRSELVKLSERYSHTQMTLVSCIAEGADRIAANEALALGWGIEIILPAPDHVYELDFQSDESRGDFRNLLTKASWIERLPAQANGQCDYLGAGIRVLQCSQMLLALWDGTQNELPGGTADIVKICLTGIPQFSEKSTGINQPDTHLVVQIITRRGASLGDTAPELIGQVRLHPPAPGGIPNRDEAERWADVFKCIDQFNLDAHRFKRAHPEKITASSANLRGDAVSSSHGAAVHLFAFADAMSIHAQKKRAQEFLVLLFLSMLAILMEQLYSGPLAKPILLFTAMILGLTAYGLYKKGGSSYREARYLDYRALAEACRVQYFWNCAGIAASAADKFLREQRDELEWIRQAIRTTQFGGNTPQSPTNVEWNRLKTVKKNWIEDQCNYFIGDGLSKQGARAKNEAQHIFFSKLASGLFYAGVVIAFFTLLISFAFDSSEAEHTTQWLGVLYGSLFSLAGLTKVYLEIKAFDEHSRNYQRSGLIMNRSLECMNQAISNKDIHSAKSILYDVGCTALNENSDWLLLHRQRPVKVPL